MALQNELPDASLMKGPAEGRAQAAVLSCAEARRSNASPGVSLCAGAEMYSCSLVLWWQEEAASCQRESKQWKQKSDAAR